MPSARWFWCAVVSFAERDAQGIHFGIIADFSYSLKSNRYTPLSQLFPRLSLNKTPGEPVLGGINFLIPFPAHKVSLSGNPTGPARSRPTRQVRMASSTFATG